MMNPQMMNPQAMGQQPPQPGSNVGDPTISPPVFPQNIFSGLEDSGNALSQAKPAAPGITDEPIEPPEVGPDGKKAPSTSDHVDYLVKAITMMNKYAAGMEGKDNANARAARMVISVLGELLKTAQYDQKKSGPPSVNVGL